MSTQAALGQAALKNSDYPTAIKHLSSALHESSSPLWLIQRSIAYQRAGQHDLALADADNAVLAAVSRARRELVATAQFRRGVALHGMGRYGDARMCFNWCHKKNEKEKGLTIWLAKVKSDYEKAGGDAAECNRVTVKEVPDKVEEVRKETPQKVEKVDGKKEEAKEVDIHPVLSAPLAPTPKDKIRHEWYQSGPQVSLTIFAKGVPKEQAELLVEEETLEIRFPILPTGTTYDFTVSPLFSKIDPTQSTFRITHHKIEIALHKATPGLKWSALEGMQSTPSSSMSSAPTIVNSQSKTEKAPTYPTSSRTGPKNWDTLATDALKADMKGGKESRRDDDFEGEEIDGFFKQIYKNADPDTRRAMIKSYQESNGTALSTNWSDVKKGPVETKPPDGLEAKKWES